MFITILSLAILAALALIVCLLLLRGELHLLRRTSAPWCWNIAAYHARRSITWSWLLSFSFLRPGERRVWPLLSRHSCGQTRWTLLVPFVGLLRWATQEQMLRSSPERNGFDFAALQALRRRSSY